MKFEKILQYQTIDAELYALENEVAASDERKAYAVAKQRIDEATEKINSLSAEANGLLRNYTTLKAKIDELKKKIDEFDGIVDGIADSGEADYYIKQISAIADSIVLLEKDAGKDSQRVGEINDSFSSTWDAGVKASADYKVARTDFDAFVRERQPKVAELQAKLENLKNDIAPEFLKIYDALRKAKKLPAFVELDATKKRCGRCYVELANDTLDKLKNPGDYTECPNCRRVIIVPDND